MGAGSESCVGSHGRIFCLGSEQDLAAYQVSLSGETIRWEGADVCVPNP